MLETGEVKSGGTALLIGFGAGLVYAAQVVACPDHRQTVPRIPRRAAPPPNHHRGSWNQMAASEQEILEGLAEIVNEVDGHRHG